MQGQRLRLNPLKLTLKSDAGDGRMSMGTGMIEDMAVFLDALRGASSVQAGLSRDVARGIRNSYLLLLQGERAERIRRMEDAILTSAEYRRRSDGMKRYLVLDRRFPQLGLMARWDLRLGDSGEEGFILPGASVDTAPVMYLPGPEENILGALPSDRIALHTAVKIYNQFVIYAIQETPMIVLLSLLNQLLRPEMPEQRAFRGTRGKDQSDGGGASAGSSIRGARDLLRLHYETASEVVEEMMMLNLGFEASVIGVQRERDFCRSYYRSLGGLGIFNFFSGWTRTGLAGFREEPLRSMFESFGAVRIRKPDYVKLQ